MILRKRLILISNLCLIFVMAGCSYSGSGSKNFAPIAPTKAITTADPTKASTTADPTQASTTAVVPTVSSPAATVTPLPVSAKRIFGVTIVPLNQQAGLENYQGLASWVRYDIPWIDIENQPGKRDWKAIEGIEQEILAAKSGQSEVIATIGSTPYWALKPGHPCGSVAEEQFAAMGDFVYDLVSRYSQPPYNLRFWEIYNEPDVNGFLGCWGDGSDPYYGGGYYGRMLKAIYPRIKQADPNAQVLVGGLLLDCDPRTPQPNCTGANLSKTTSSKFFEGILSEGAGDSFDGVSFHAYDYFTGLGQYNNSNWFTSSSTTGPSALAKATYLRELMAKYNVSNKYLMDTEMGLLSCGRDQNEVECLNDGDQREQTKSSYLVQSYVYAMADGEDATLWYSSLGTRGTGLLNSDLSPRLSFQAYRFASMTLNGAAYVSEQSSAIMRVFEFRNEKSRVWVVWSRDGSSQTLSLPDAPEKIFDMFGNTIAAGPSITTDWKPIYVQFGG